MKKFIQLISCVSLIALTYTSMLAQNTEITVRAKAKDGKFIGTTMGGIYITVEDAITGKILSEGKTTGSTGNTNVLMVEPQERHTPLADEGNAKFVASLDIEEPRLVTIKGYGPLGFQQSAIEVSTQIWAIPGNNISGDGIILEMPGFVVDVIGPAAHSFLSAGEVEIVANIVMMCGCSTSEGGLWDSSEYEITAHIKRNDEFVAEIPMSYTGQTSMYSAIANVIEPGAYEMVLTVFHEKTGNTGVDKTTFIIN